MSRWLTKQDGKWIMSEPKPLGKREIDGREAIGYRVSRDTDVGLPEKQHWSADLWVDAQNGKLVFLNNPGLNIYDPEKDPARNNPPGKQHGIRAMGYEVRDIVYDSELDDSLFSLETPQGYVVTTIKAPEPTEKEMVEWLGIYAACNGNVFPDDPRPPSDKIWKKSNKKQKLSAAEQKVLHLSYAVHQRRPVRQFAEKVAGKSWHYAGKGVRLGEKDQIVCWYKPKDSQKYRVVYGDLSVKDVLAEDLPLDTSPK